METLCFHLCGEELELHPFRAIYHPAEGSLLLADLHLGKARHFRRGGLPAPLQANHRDLQRLTLLINHFPVKHLIFLGDLFHSDLNRDWEDFCRLREAHPEIAFDLVVGNHDILERAAYIDAGITLHEKPLEYGPFLLSHEPEEEDIGALYNLCGHIHPGVSLRGRGRQYLRLPCFYFGERQGILPAFGAMTGAAKIPIVEGDRVFAVVQERVVQVGG